MIKTLIVVLIITLEILKMTRTVEILILTQKHQKDLPKWNRNNFFDYSLLISHELFITQIVHFCKAVISNFSLYLQC